MSLGFSFIFWEPCIVGNQVHHFMCIWIFFTTMTWSYVNCRSMIVFRAQIWVKVLYCTWSWACIPGWVGCPVSEWETPHESRVFLHFLETFALLVMRCAIFMYIWIFFTAVTWPYVNCVIPWLFFMPKYDIKVSYCMWSWACIRTWLGAQFLILCFPPFGSNIAVLST